MDQFDIALLWKHCLTTAAAARAIGTAEGLKKPELEDCFTGGLLHDIGKLVLMGSLPDQYRRVVARLATEEISVLQVEREVCGCTHAEVGAYLTGIWGLPHSIVEVVAWHHLPSAAGGHEFRPLTAVHLADALASSNQPGCWGHETNVDEPHLVDIGRKEREDVWRQICNETADNLKLVT